jgi:hypothetical protein
MRKEQRETKRESEIKKGCNDEEKEEKEREREGETT